MKTIALLFFAMLTGFISMADESQPYFLSSPALSPDGKMIVFTYENDLWKVNSSGGTATRITAMEGVETNARFSPDGKWIAFSSSRNGNDDIFVVPAGGGELNQITYHDADDKVESWSWDSKFIYFTSGRYNLFTTYKVALNGGTPERLFGHYFNMPHHMVEDPSTNAVYFTESWESYRFAHRKHYKGDHNPDIKKYDFESKAFSKLTSYRGKDMWPTIDRTGRLYFASDEGNEQYNLYVLENDSKRQLTHFESAIGRPQVSADGSKIVFCKDYQIYLYDTNSGESLQPQIILYQEDFLSPQKAFSVKGEISYFDISPDEKKIAFVSRGRLFVSDRKGKFIEELPVNPLEKVDEVKWLKNNKDIIYTQTDRGWTNLFIIAADGSKGPKQITNEDKNIRFLEYDQERDRLLYVSGTNELKLMNFPDFKEEVLVEDEFWFRGSQPRFSPDGKYVVYTAYRNFEEDIFIYNMSTGEQHNLTHNGVPESAPFWSPDGKYLYFAADRFNTRFPRGTEDNRLYRLPLYKFQESFKSEQYNQLFTAEEKKKKGKEEKKPEVKLDLSNLETRWESLRVSGGEQSMPFVMMDGDKHEVLFMSNHDEGKYGLWKMTIEPFEKRKTKKISDGYARQIVKAGDGVFALMRGSVFSIDMKTGKLSQVEMNYSFEKSLGDEFKQMFYENWAVLAENFYDEDYHGVDWKKIKAHYEQFVPHLRTRENLRQLLNDMLGELNASHLAFSSRGDEEETFYGTSTTETGILFSETNPYVVERIIAKSPLDITGVPVKKGDKLKAVNGVLVNTATNRNKYFTFTELKEELKLTFLRGKEEVDVFVHPVSSSQFDNLLYDEWVENNQKRVDAKSENRIAYVYMKNMGGGSLNDFLIDMTTEAVHREALILDLRYNRGGNVHDDVLQFISQQPYLQWKFRDGKMAPQPNFAPAAKPIVLLMNEHSLSDAEMTAAGFKALDLGTIVGTETYRWIIFTSGTALVDGSWTRLPVWGCYDLEGNDLEMTGVKPDIYIENTFKDRLEGEDPQLDKAIEIIMQQL